MTNMDDKDYIGEEEGDGDMLSTVDSVKGVTKDSAAVETQLITSNEMASRVMIRENGRKKKEGENLQGAVNGM